MASLTKIGLVVVMAATIGMTGSGTIGELAAGWSVQQDATPVAPGVSDGSVGSASIEAAAMPDSAFIGKNDLTLTHPQLGAWYGRVNTPAVTGMKVSAAVDGAAAFLNVTVTAPPQLDFTYSQSAFTSSPVFQTPLGVAIDSSRNIYVSDYYLGSSRIQKFNSAGAPLLSFGLGGTGDGQFAFAPLMATDAAGNVYAVDNGNNRVQKFNSSGTFVSKFGTAGSGNGQFNGPIGIAIDSAGFIYVADGNNNRIQKFTAAGAFVMAFGTLGSAAGQFNQPYGVAVNSAGQIFVTDSGNNRIQKFTPGGTLLASWGVYAGGVSSSPGSMFIDNNGDLLVAVFGLNQVQKFSAYGKLLALYGSTGSAVDQYNAPTGIGVDSTGRMIVGDASNNRVRISTPTGAAAGIPLSAVFQRYVDLAVINHPVNYTASTNPLVTFPAWTDKCWAKLKELTAAYGVELVSIGNVLTVRDVAAVPLDISNRTAPTLSVDQGTGQSVTITVQNPTAVVGGEFFNAKTSNTIYTVDVLAQQTVLLQTTHSPTVLATPTPTDTPGVGPGQYFVQDSTGAAVAAADWLYYGGRVLATAGPALGQITLTLYGPRSNIPGKTGPFSLASGSSTLRQSELSIAGTGVLVTPTTINLLTGADPAIVTQAVASTVNSPFIATAKQAYTRGSWAADLAAGPIMTLTWSTSAAQLAGFGLDVGSIVTYNGSKYRVTNITYGNLIANLTAKRHCTIFDVFDMAQWLFKDDLAANAGLLFSDVATARAGLTFAQVFALHPDKTNAQMKAIWAGYSNADTKIQPLKGL